MTTPIHQGGDPAALDVQVLGRYLRSVNAYEGSDEPSWKLLAGGKSNLTYMVSAGGRDLVLRRPPLGSHDPRAHDVGREYRMLAALHPLGLRVPEPVAYCEDASIIGSPFYVMKRVVGRVITSRQVAPDLTSPESLRQLVDTVVDGLVELHGVDPQAAGLGHIGKPQGFAARQVARWTRGWQERQHRAIPDLDEAARRLQAGMDAGLPLDAERASIVHGDYNLGNLLISNEGPPELVGILDWEMSALGHPMMDLGLLVTYSQFLRTIYNVDDPIAELPGFPDATYFAERYARKSGQSTEMLDYFRALAFFKIIVITEALRAAFLAGTTRGEGFEKLGEHDIENAAALLDLMNQSNLDCLRGRPALRSSGVPRPGNEQG